MIATHGRSFWIVDDLTPLHREAATATDNDGGTHVGTTFGADDDTGIESDVDPGHGAEVGFTDVAGAALSADGASGAGAGRDSEPTKLYSPRPAWRLLPGVMDFITATEGKDYSIGLGKPATFVATRDDSGQVRRRFLDAGEAAPVGAIVYYSLPENLGADGTGCEPSTTAPANDSDTAGAATSRVSIAFHDAGGALIREFRPKPAGYDKLSDEDKALDPGPWMPAGAGVNRFVWDLRYPGAMRLRGNKTGEEADRGPLVLPGACQVRLRVGDRVLVETFDVVNDPRSPATIDDLREQLDCLLAIRDKISAAYEGVQRIRDTSGEIERWCARLSGRDGHDAALRIGEALCEALSAVESALILPGEHTDTFGLHHRVRLNAALASVISIVDSADARPTAQARMLAEEYMAGIDTELGRLEALLDHDLGTFNRLVSETGLPPIGSP